MGDSGGGVGESGSLVGSAGVFFDCCGGGIIWAGHCFCIFKLFPPPSPSVIESPLSLLLFKSVKVSISSCGISFCFICCFFFSFSLYCMYFFFSCFGFSAGFPPPVFLILPVLAGGDFGALGGDFLPRVTWGPPLLLVIGVVPSFCRWNVTFFFFFFFFFPVSFAVVTVVLVVFCWHDLEKWPICLQCQHCGFQPSTTAIMA